MLFSVLRIGIPAGLESVMYNISNIVIQVFVNNLGTDTVAGMGNSWENRCYFLDGDQCVRNFHYYLCGTEFRSRQISSYAKECECLHGHEYGQFCGDDHFDVFICSLDLSSVYHRQRSDRPWCSYESFFYCRSYFIYVIIGILSGALRGTGKVLVPMLLTCGGVCSLRILWLFTAGQMYPGINTIMLSYPVSWSITAVLFVVYYFMKFPGKEKAEHFRRQKQ